jgi:hypothetical protein
MAFPLTKFNEACAKQDYVTAERLIDLCGINVTDHHTFIDSMRVNKIQSPRLTDIIFNKLNILDIVRCDHIILKIICNNPTMLDSLLRLHDTPNTTDQLYDLLQKIIPQIKDEECIVILSNTKLIDKLNLNLVESKVHQAKLIKLLGFEKAKKFHVFMPCLYEYSVLICDEKWDGKMIEHSDPNYTPLKYDFPLVLAIQRGRYDYVGKLIDIIDNSEVIKKMDCRRNGQMGSHENGNNILTYSIANNKFRCTEVILSKLGDFCTKIEHNNEKLDVFEYCMMVNDIRTLKLFAKTNHKTYCTGLDPIDIFRFIIRFDPVRRHSMWTLIREKYIKDRELCGEPLTEDEHFMDKQLTVITDKVENIEITLQSRERRELHDIAK